MTAAALGLIAALPWMGLLPLHGAASVLAHVLTLVAALHGAGQTLALATRREEVAPTLALQWGVAVLVTLGGALMSAHAFGYAAQVVIVNAFAAVHTVVVGRRARSARVDLHGLWLVPVLLLVGLGALHVLAAAGDVGARPFDDDGNMLAQLQRLRDTGTLGDGVGYLRRAQLGGQLALSAFATVPGDVHLLRQLEPIALVLALALTLARLGIRDAFGALLAMLVVITAFALALVPGDPVTCWTAVGLVLALHAAVTDEPRPPSLVVGLLAGALVTLRLELAPIALAALVTAWRQRPARAQSRSLLAGALVAAGPYLVVRAIATRGVDTALLADHRLPLLVAIAAFAGTCLACAPIAIWTWRSPLRWYGLATVLALGGIVGELTGDRPYALRFVWPLALGFALLLVLELARTRTLSIALMIVTLLAGAVIHHGRSTTGRAKWARRYLDDATHLEYLRVVGDQAPVAGGYDGLLTHVPHGSTVAVWVARPERLPYGADLTFVDLRTPRTTALRRHRWEAHASKLDALTRAAHATFALVERDDQHLVRAHDNTLYRLLCATPRLACADDLELLAARHPVIAEHDGVVLIDLR